MNRFIGLSVYRFLAFKARRKSFPRNISAVADTAKQQCGESRVQLGRPRIIRIKAANERSYYYYDYDYDYDDDDYYLGERGGL